ncbi:ABC transporter ATP-binding protein [uncultured Aeromicrobium sp.]|uniref:ABC transporter ATP-binding protein n=1 Tax=uncultured Aeromicrobium sp. TaxID=337820 RepID=UPI0025FDEDCF|nr:ABC transporter ATP-binding protein [uncultured Aeromicrobium sp.]
MLSASHPLVDFRSVGRTFGSVEALAPCDLSVGRGEFVSIIGPSGCGKSTLLRLASQLDTPTSGSIDFATDSVGYVFQDATLMPWRTVERNVGLLAELGGMSKAKTATAVEAALATVGLTDFAQHLPRQLSGGMKMRASLARSLVMKPEVFLFDEPFGALDEITRGRLQLVLQDLFLEHRFAGLFVTHSVEEAVFLSTRVVVMSARPGRIVEEFEIGFDQPRSLDLKYDPAFAELAGRVAKCLEEAS